MLKKISFIIFLLLVSISIVMQAEEDSNEVAYDLLIKLIPQDYESVSANLFDVEQDGQEELFGAVVKLGKDGIYFTKIYIFECYDSESPLIWESEDIKGYIIDNGFFIADQQRHFWLDIFRSDLNLHQIWIFRWDGVNTKRVYPYADAENGIVSEQVFACWHKDENGELEIKAILKSQNKTIVYVLRNAKLVVKREEYINTLVNVPNNKKPLEEKYPNIAKLLGRYYNSYQLIEIEQIDFEKKIYMCKVVNKTDEKDEKLIIVEDNHSVTKIWYDLPNEYAGYLYYISLDVNHDGYQEVVFFDAYLHTEPGVYILSIQPDCFYLVTPADEDDYTLVYLHGPIYFEDFNKDSYIDIMIDSVTEPTYLYWNEQQQRFECK